MMTAWKQEDVQVTIFRLKDNKAAGLDGLPAELFETGGKAHAPIYLQNIAGLKDLSVLYPLLINMSQVQGYKISPNRIRFLRGIWSEYTSWHEL